MRNRMREGETLNYINAGVDTIMSGSAVSVGCLIGIAATDIEPGAEGALRLDGVYDLPKAVGETWEQGQALKFDPTTGEFGVSAGSVSGNACAFAPAGADDMSGMVLINLGPATVA